MKKLILLIIALCVGSMIWHWSQSIVQVDPAMAATWISVAGAAVFVACSYRFGYTVILRNLCDVIWRHCDRVDARHDSGREMVKSKVRTLVTEG